MTFQDELTKFIVAEPILTDAETVARVFVRNIVLKFGLPELVLTDQGSNFLSELFQNTCKLLHIKRVHTTAFHPESNGGLERGHRVLVEYLRHCHRRPLCFTRNPTVGLKEVTGSLLNTLEIVTEDQTDWDDWIPYATHMYNVTTHRATGYTPFKLLFGHRAQVPSP